MSRLPYTFNEDDPATPPLGLIILQTDETIEGEFKRYFADLPNPLYVTRIASELEVTTQMLWDMEERLAGAATLLPKARPYRAIGYACTSASSIIGSDQVEKMVKRACNVETVTNPLRAATLCAKKRGISRLALLSPYIEEVNVPLREAFAQAGLSTDVFATFGEIHEEKVVRIYMV